MSSDYHRDSCWYHGFGWVTLRLILRSRIFSSVDVELLDSCPGTANLRVVCEM